MDIFKLIIEYHKDNERQGPAVHYSVWKGRVNTL